MLRRVAVIFTLSVLGAGCTTGAGNAPLAGNHPANPSATESPILPPSPTLTLSDAVTTAPAQEPSGMNRDMNHSMSGMQHDHRLAATQPATTQAAIFYTCTMHPEVMLDKPGKCPKCGMKLVLKRDAKTSDRGGHE